MTRRMGYGPKPTGMWERIPGINGGSCASQHVLDTIDGSDWRVIHCGHPTANWPWYGRRPDGSIIIGSNGYAFQFLQDAKVAVEAEYRKVVLDAQ